MPDPIQMLIEIALQEDIGSGDITTQALLGEDQGVKTGIVLAKQDLVLAGLDVMRRVFLTVDHHLHWEAYGQDGQRILKGTKVAQVSGHHQSLLRAERTALNFVQHLSGVATLTRQYVEKVKNYSVKILDTRKTTPGFRLLEKQAVQAGGGSNHRMGLYDRFLIKDNHLAGRSITESIRLAKKNNPKNLAIEIEVENLNQIEEAIAAGADTLLIDNFSPQELAKAVQQVSGRAKTEASGGIHLGNVEDFAKTGVDAISVGALTHSAPAADLSLQIN